MHLSLCGRVAFRKRKGVTGASPGVRGEGLDAQGPRLVKNGVRCIVGDSGYRDKARAAAYAAAGVLLLTPDTGWAQAWGG